MPKKKSKQKSLTFISIILGALALVAIIAFIICINVIMTNAEKRGRESVEVFAEQTSLRLEDLLETHGNVLHQLKSNFSGDTTSDDIKPVLARYRENWSALDVGLLFSDETAMGYNGESVVFESWIDPMSVEGHASSVRIVRNKVAGVDILAFAVSADFKLDDDKNCIGYFMSFHISKLDSVMEKTEYANEESTFISVITQSGDTVWRSNTETWDTNMFEDLQNVKFESSGEISKIEQRLELNLSGTAVYSLNGEKFILAYVPLDSNYWNMVLVLSYDTVIEQNTNNILTLVLVSSIIILVSLCITFYFFYRQRSAELRKKQTEIQAARVISETKAKSDFLSRMSHELRTPLNGIVGMIELTSRYGDDRQKREEYLGKIRTSSEYLVSLINDILDMAKIEHKKMTFSIEPFNMKDVSQSLTDIFEPMTSDKGLEFEMDCSELKNDCFIGDEMRLKQVVINLLSNAVKFTDKGSVRCKIRNYDLDSKNYIEIKVSDTGTGISPENRERIFKPFEQENTPTSRTKTGTGLGLAICVSLVKLAGGNITCDSKVGEGSTFTVTLPCEVTSKEVHALTVDTSTDLRLDGLTILLAEDNDLNAEIAEELLTCVGAKVIRASNGKEACDKFALSSKGEIDVVLMDIQMPILDGFEATKIIRRSTHPDAKSVPVIAMTANAMSEDREQAMSAGMNDHVSKPIYVDKIGKIILQYTRKSE